MISLWQIRWGSIGIYGTCVSKRTIARVRLEQLVCESELPGVVQTFLAVSPHHGCHMWLRINMNFTKELENDHVGLLGHSVKQDIAVPF